MSPEQAQGQPLDHRSDIYSLGVMLFEMATGRRPFVSDTPYSIAVMHVTQPPPNPRSINPKIPLQVENVILTAMSKHRDSRYSDATTLAEAVRRAINPPASNLYDTQPGFARPELPPIAEPAPRPAPYLPPPPSGTSSYVPVGGTSNNYSVVQRRVRPERKSNLLFSAALGGLLGCGLLTLVVIVLALIITNLLQQQIVNEQAQTETVAAATNTAGTSPPRSTLDLTSQSARSTLVGGATPGEDGTPTPAEPTLNASAGQATRLLVYAAERNNNFDVYTLNLDTDRETRLTSSSLNDIYPVVSPDGERIAFTSDSDGDFEIWVMDIDGRNQRRLTQNEVNDRYPAWSPDGDWIVYSADVRGDGNFDLYRARADGNGEPVEVFSDGERNSFPHWRDSAIVFTNGSNSDAGTWEIARLEVSESGDVSGDPVFLTDNSVKDWSPAIAPDGSIFYLTEGEGRSAIARLDADGGNRSIVYDGARYEWGVTFGPDGNVIFTSDQTGRDELYVMTADGEDVEQLTTNGAMSASWAAS
jgi:TolB protein